MYLHSKKITKQILTIGLLIITMVMKAQQPVTVTTMVMPPFSTSFAYYIDNPNTIQVTFINTSSQPLDVYVHGKLTGDNGVEIQSDPTWHPATSITLNPGIPFHLTQDNIADIFSSNHVVYNGITQNELADLGGLPEGNYQFCFSVFDFNTGNRLSAENMECSNMIVIAYIDPPVILNPVCGDSIVATVPQNILISWTTPVGGGPNIKYKFVMVEMHPGDRNPNDALMSAAPPFFLEKDLSIPQLLISPSDPPLIEGRSYAFYVQAYDPDNQVIFNNNGISEACWFNYKAASVIHLPDSIQFGEGIGDSIPDMLNGQFVSISGNIHYRYVEDNSSGPVTNEQFDVVEMFVIKKPDGEFINLYGFKNHTTSDGTMIQMSYNFVDPQTGNAIPDDSVTINTGFLNNGTTQIAEDGSFVVSGGVTDKQGNFSTGVVIPPNSHYGLLKHNVKAQLLTTSSHMEADAGGAIHNYTNTSTSNLGTGDLYRVLRIVLHDSHLFGHPNQMIIPDGNTNLVYNNLEALVRTFNVEVTVIGMGHNTNKGDGSYVVDGPLAGMYGKLIRNNSNLPLSFPDYEGITSHQTNPPLNQMVAESVTGNNGVLHFSKIIQYPKKDFGYTSGQYSDRLSYMVKPTETGEANYNNASGNYVMLPDVPDNIFSTVHDNNWPVPTAGQETHVTAKAPKIFGLVQDAKNKITLGEVLIYLYGYDKEGNQADFRWAFTQTDGKYEFDNVQPDLKYKMVAGKYGYVLGNHNVNSFKPMGTGVKEYYEFDLEPLSGLYGTIVNESGEGIPVHVYLDGGYQFAFTPDPDYMALPQIKYMPTEFHIDVPENQIHMIIDADDEEYADWDTSFVIQGKYVKLGNIVLKKESRKLRLQVNTASGKWGLLSPLANAKVVINGISDTLLTANDGYINYSFQSASSTNNFEVTISSPDAQDYQTQHLNMYIPVSHNYTSYNVVLKRGASVSGHVLDNNNNPVENAIVKWNNGSTNGEYTTQTDKNGFYTLRGLPKNRTVEISATKPASQFIGQVKNFGTFVTNGTLDFTLQQYNGMNISHLLDFAMAVESLQETGGQVKISGYLYNLPSNQYFAPENSSQQIPFSNVTVVPKNDSTGATPKAYPQNGFFISDVNRINITTLGFNTLAYSSRGIEVKETSFSSPPSGSSIKTGALQSKLFINAASLQINKVTFNDNPQLFEVTASRDESAKITTLNAKGLSETGNPNFRIYGQNKQPLAFNIYRFDATAQPANSYLKQDTLNFRTNLHTQLANTTPSDLNIDIGNLKLTKDKVLPVHGNSNLQIGLQDWTIRSTDWSFGKLGFNIIHGKLDMRGTVIPFSNMKVRTTSLYRGEFDFSNLKLLDLKKLTFTPDVKTFLSSQNNYWRFEIFPADNQSYSASIDHLPALDASDKIFIEKVVLFSRMSIGSYYKLTEHHPWVNVYNTMRFRPSQMYVYTDKISLSGVFDTGIPNTDQQYYFSRLKYVKDASSNLSFNYEPFEFTVQDNACLMKFRQQNRDNRQSLTANGFMAKGSISEYPLFNFKIELTKTASTHINTATVKPFVQKWNFSNGKTLHNIRGSITAAQTSWPDFAFVGDVEKDEFNGAGGPMAFVVKGELTGDPAKSTISLNKVDTPFGEMNFTFDASVPSIVGNLSFDKKIGTAQIKGGIQMVLDNRGWYFIGGGSMKFPNPYFEEGMAGITFGDYPVNDFIKNQFLAYSGVQFPNILFPDRLNGFMFAGTVVMQPSPIPDIDFDAGIASLEFDVDVGASMGMGANFDKADFLVLSDAYLYAFFKVTAMGVVSGEVDGKTYAGALGMINLNTGHFYAKGHAGLIMSGNITVAGKEFIGGTFQYGVAIEVEHKPNNVSFSIE